MRNINLEKPRKGLDAHRYNRLHINIRETMSYDIRIHGVKFIVTEFSLATILGAGVALLYLLYPHVSPSTRLYGGLFWLGLLVNFLTILLLSVSLARRGTRKELDMELTGLEISKLRRLTILIGIVIVLPFATFVIATYQTLRRTRP